MFTFKQKKFLLWLSACVAVMALIVIAGCNTASHKVSEKDKIQIIATNGRPGYILGSDVDLWLSTTPELAIQSAVTRKKLMDDAKANDPNVTSVVVHKLKVYDNDTNEVIGDYEVRFYGDQVSDISYDFGEN
jgi:hypothetical protein